MNGKRIALIAAVFVGAAAVGLGAVWDRLRVRPSDLNASEPAAKPAAAADKSKAPDEPARKADQEAVRAAVKDFIKAFEKGDAKGLTALFTEEGEYVANDGATLRGRAAMEDGYAQFFKKNPDMKLEVNVDSIRFVSKDNGVLEGAARSYKAGKPGDPTTSRISGLYVRENGQWRLALLREWPDEGTTLDDVDWLIGTWESKSDSSGRPHDLRVGGRQELHPRPLHDQGEGQGRGPLRHAAHRQGPAHRPAALVAVRERRRLRRGRLDLGRQGLAARRLRRRTGRRRSHGDQRADAAGEGRLHLAIHRADGGRRRRGGHPAGQGGARQVTAAARIPPKEIPR